MQQVHGSKEGTPWSEEDTRIACDLAAAKMPYAQIAERLGRGSRSVRNKVFETRQTPEQRRERLERKYASRNSRPKDSYTPHPVQPADRAADEIAMDTRDRRLAISPRDLTAWFCGDPLPGYSALERMTR